MGRRRGRRNEKTRRTNPTGSLFLGGERTRDLGFVERPASVDGLILLLVGGGDKSDAERSEGGLGDLLSVSVREGVKLLDAL